MKLFRITFLFVLISFSAFAKDSTSVEFKRFALGIHASPDYCFRTLINNDGSASSNNVASFRNGIEIPKLGYTAGIGLLCNINKNFALELGMHYSNKGYQTAWQDFTYLVPPTSQPDPALPIRYKEKYHFSCIDFPLIAHFKFGQKKLSFAASAGIVTNIILYERVEQFKEFIDGTRERHKGASNFIYNPLNFSPMIGLGTNLKLGKKTTLKLLPTFRYGVLQIIDAPVSGRLWNVGLDIGFYINL